MGVLIQGINNHFLNKYLNIMTFRPVLLFKMKYYTTFMLVLNFKCLYVHVFTTFAILAKFIH